MQAPLAPGRESPSATRRYVQRHQILYIDCDSSQTGDPSRIRWVGEMGGEIDLITAPTGEGGIHLARCQQPDLILLELGPPWGRAVEVIARLRESRETSLIPLVALSSAHCENLPGLSMYCRRPIQAPELLAMLRLLLQRTPDVRCRSTSSNGRKGSALGGAGIALARGEGI